jgi:hypothetical protein
MEVIVHLSSTHYQVIGIVEQARTKETMLSHDTRLDTVILETVGKI